MNKASRILVFLLLLGLSHSVFAQTNRPDDFHERYTLKQVVVLSRHNIRSPLSRRNSAIQRITPHEWYHWSSAPSELSLRGGALETMMGQYFRKWLVSEGLMRENEIPDEGTMRYDTVFLLGDAARGQRPHRAPLGTRQDGLRVCPADHR